MNRALLLLCLFLLTTAVGVAPTAAAPASLRVLGTVSALSSGSLTLATSGGQSLTFRLVATTSYVENGMPVAESALAVGQSATVKYHVEPNGTLKAKEVKVETVSGPASAAVRVRGQLLSASATDIVIKTDAGQNLTVHLASTTIYEKDGHPATAADLRAGELLKVKYRVETNGSLKAQKIKIVVQHTTSFQLEGVLLAASATSLKVRVSGLRENSTVVRAAGRTVALTLAATSTVVENGHTARAGSLARGDRVHAVGTVSGGSFLASHVVAQRSARKK